MALSLAQVVIEPLVLTTPLPLYVVFPVIAITSTIITVVVALSTPPTDNKTMVKFYTSVQPAGSWSPIRDQVLGIQPEFRFETSFTREAMNTLFALVGICALYVGTLYLILHRLSTAFGCFTIATVLSIVLYFTWYKHLPEQQAVEVEDNEVVEAVAKT